MIGIINVQWYDNPGAVLLCYALQKTVTDLRKEKNIIIDYALGGGTTHKRRMSNRVLDLPNRIKQKLLRKTTIISNKKYVELLSHRHNKYEQFREQFLKRTERFINLDSEILDTNFTACIVGSDVVWKPEIADSPHSKIYFLQFSQPNMKRISYAASIGTEQVSILDSMKEKYIGLLQGFNHISVREKSAQKYISTLFPNKSIKHVLDPVLLLSAAQYSTFLSDKHPYKGNKYVYLYLLTFDEKAVEDTYRYAQEQGWNVVMDIHSDDVLGGWRRWKNRIQPSVDVGPSDFLTLIAYAECVVSDSFHATAFATIFQKQFCTYGRINAGINISSRMKDYLKMIGLSDHYVVDDLQKAMNPIDYNKVSLQIEELRNDSIYFLNEVLG